MINLYKIRYKIIIPPVVIFLLLLIFFIFLFFPPQILVTPDFGLSDVLNLNFPYKDNLSNNLKHFQLPLWSDKIGSGYPIFAEGQTGTLNLLNLLLFYIFPSYLAFNLGYFFSFLTIGLGTYWYCRIINLSRSSSLWASIVFTFSAVFTVRLMHFNLLQAASFLPVILGLTEKIRKEKKIIYSLINSFLLTQSYFAGFPQMTFIIIFAQIIYLAVSFYQAKKIDIKNIFLFIISLIFFLGLIAIQLLPSIELISTSTRGSNIPLSEIFRFSYSLKYFILFFNPFIYGNPAIGTYPYFGKEQGIYWENIAYLGILPIIFTAIYLFYFKKKSSYFLIYFLLLGISLLLSLGQNSPFYLVYSFFPFTLFRVPSRFLILSAFSLSLISALALEKLTIIKSFSRRNLTFTLFLGFTVWQLFSFGRNFQPAGRVEKWLEKPEIGKSIPQNARIYSLPSYSLWNKEFTKKGWQNLDYFYHLRNNLYPNSNLLFGLSHYGVYPVLQTKRHFLTTSLLEKNILVDEKKSIYKISEQGLNLLRKNNITYLTSPYKIENANLIKVKTLSKPFPYYLYQITSQNSKYYLAKTIKVAKTIDELSYYVENNPKEKVVLEKNLPVKLHKNSGAKITILKDQNDQAKITINSLTDNLIVRSVSFYPGWKAYLDGKEIEIFPANINQQAIIVPRGKHSIEYLYKPLSFQVGFLISGFSFIFWLLLFFKNMGKSK